MQEVITNLGAARLEFRAEDDPDVTPYTHGRNIEVDLYPGFPCFFDCSPLGLPVQKFAEWRCPVGCSPDLHSSRDLSR